MANPSGKHGVSFVAVCCILSILSVVPTSLAATRYLEFDFVYANYTRNCVTKPVLTVNGMYPGPRIDVTEGDRVIVKVTNSADTNVTIHWHGIRQMLSAWQDGASYITNCPIQPGDYFTYDFVVSGQRGTTLWHAHSNWVRATVYGAFVTHPLSQEYPFPRWDQEFLLIVGEWWDEDIEVIRQRGLSEGSGYQVADTLTINGYPGPYYNCSDVEGVPTFDIQHGKTYLLRLINAAMDSDVFFGVANHKLTVVEADSSYVQPITVDCGISISPGQTVVALLTADQPAGSYYAAAAGHETVDALIANNTDRQPDDIPSSVPLVPSAAIFQYVTENHLENRVPFFPDLPPRRDMEYSYHFHDSLKSITPVELSANAEVRKLLFAVGIAAEWCTEDNPCTRGHDGYRFTLALNNITFVMPNISVLEAYYYNVTNLLFPFPDQPIIPFNYTSPESPPEEDQVANLGTSVIMVEYGETIELVLQDTHNIAFVSHPFHFHGYNFYIIGAGSGNFDPEKDPQNFNYYDPPSRFTVSMRQAGWVAIRFKADNPGAWLFHCHYEKHVSGGLEVVFMVKNGVGPDQTLPPPPRLNKC